MWKIESWSFYIFKIQQHTARVDSERLGNFNLSLLGVFCEIIGKLSSPGTYRAQLNQTLRSDRKLKLNYERNQFVVVHMCTSH